MTVKVTEFKIKTNKVRLKIFKKFKNNKIIFSTKPKPKSYPGVDDESEVKVNGQVKKEQMSEDEHENENNNEKVNGTASEEKETKPEV